MPRKTVTEETEAEAPVAPVEVVEAPVEQPSVDSPEKAAYRKHIAAYKAQNPEKYELKKEMFERKLNSL